VDVRAVDLSATSKRSALHRAAPVAKLAAFGLALGAIVVQNNVLVVAGVAFTVAALAVGSRLPLRLVFSLAAYPGVFAVVFAFAAAPDPLTGSLFVAKAIGAALCAVVLVCTTPYPQIFAPIQRIVPEVVGDAMLMTYRSLFLLMEKFDRLRVAVRLRSGLARHQPLRAVRATASALGGLVLYALDLSQREYDVMRLRGYSGRLRVTLPRSGAPGFDAALLSGAAALLALAVVFRLAGAGLTPYSWLPPVAALFALLTAVGWRLTRR
jgi:energy-coupling factor transporter transmembrane protein EcfT